MGNTVVHKDWRAAKSPTTNKLMSGAVPIKLIHNESTEVLYKYFGTIQFCDGRRVYNVVEGYRIVKLKKCRL